MGLAGGALAYVVEGAGASSGIATLTLYDLRQGTATRPPSAAPLMHKLSPTAIIFWALNFRSRDWLEDFEAETRSLGRINRADSVTLREGGSRAALWISGSCGLRTDPQVGRSLGLATVLSGLAVTRLTGPRERYIFLVHFLHFLVPRNVDKQPSRRQLSLS